jgi:dTDP-4-dehydrorhamnose reductase
MKILITGANGFLGYYLARQLLQKGNEVIATGKGHCRLPFSGDAGFSYCEMDFTDASAVRDVLAKMAPEVVIHAGAMSKPDECELNREEAYKVNVEATLTLLNESAKLRSYFLFVSTDFVFDGHSGMYKEDDPPAPVNFYGQTKADAEKAVKEYKYEWGIVRTVLVYGKPVSGRSNILTIVKEKLENKQEYKVVDDQVRTPTYVEDLASGIVSMIEKKAKGIYHLSGKDIFTPYQMAIQAAQYLGLDASLIKRVTAADFSQPARRPEKTGFNIDKAVAELGFSPVSFEEGLRKTFL